MRRAHFYCNDSYPKYFFSAQIVGGPEICRMSIREAAYGSQPELFIIGKNFVRGARVLFRQYAHSSSSSSNSVSPDAANGDILWEREAEVDANYFYQV